MPETTLRTRATRKAIATVEWKADQPGSFVATVATFDVIDKDGDVTIPGAFPVGKEIPISAYGHKSWDGEWPIGKGTISADKTKAWVAGQLFLDTPQGQAAYTTLKALGPLAEWSYGFNPKVFDFGKFADQDVRFLRDLDVFEASPVLVGAGVGTGTTAIKSVKSPIAAHDTPTTDQEWDAGANVARIASDAGAAVLRRMYAWIDEDADADTKAAYKFPHHEVSSGGAVGAANVRGCIAGIAVLNGSRGGADIPEADRAGVHRHLGAHMMDADMEPPELRAKSMRTSDHIARVLRALPAAAAYAAALTAAKDGRVLSSDSLASLDSALAALDTAAQALRELRARGIREESGDGDGKDALQRTIQHGYYDLLQRGLRVA